MRIMLDTNVLVSMLLFPTSPLNIMMERILSNHELILSSFVVDELKDVVRRKFPTKSDAVDKLLLDMRYELVSTPDAMGSSVFYIREKKDYPVLYTAVIRNVDILITGDKDFFDVPINKPKILTPSAFMATYL